MAVDIYHLPFTLYDLPSTIYHPFSNLPLGMLVNW